jgi:hypothetical protein
MEALKGNCKHLLVAPCSQANSWQSDSTSPPHSGSIKKDRFHTELTVSTLAYQEVVMAVQGAVAAMEVLKGKCKHLMDGAAVLADKLAAERRHTAGLVSVLHEREAAGSVQEARMRRLIELLVAERKRHRQTLDVLDSVCKQLHMACKKEGEVRLELKAVSEALEGREDAVKAFRDQLAACTAEAEQARWQGLEAEKRLQARLQPFLFIVCEGCS